MEREIWFTILGLGIASYVIRLAGYVLAQRLPRTGGWARGMEALPGCLIVALVALMMLNGDALERCIALVVLLIGAWTRNLPISMLAGMALIAGARQIGL